MSNLRPRGRPRSSELKHSILQAALHECEKNGYSNLTIENIAKAAGVSKPTLYRWWSSKAAIVLEALTVETGNHIPVPDYGEIGKDLRKYLQNTCDVLNQSKGQIIRELIGVSQLDSVFAEQFWNDFLLTRRQGLLEILRRAEIRSEIHTGHDLEFIMDLCYGTIWYRLLNRNGSLDEGLVEQIVSTALYKLKAY